MSKDSFFPKIAIVGMGALVPGARTLGEFWSNILNGKDCIEDVPESFWNHQDYYDSDPFARDKTYCKRGGFLPPVEFDCVEFGIPPNVLESTSLNQLLALKVAKDTLLDAQLLGDTALTYDKSKTGVILGANLGGSAFPLRERITLPTRIQDMLNRYGVEPEIIQRVVGDLQEGFIDWNENSFPGFLPNIVSGRIVNRFDFGGPNFTVDAACASSLCAMMQAVHELQTNSCDLVLTGGVNVSNDPLSYLSFSKTPALSLNNQIRPYDKDADGMLVGDGIGMMVMMRLEDAEAAGHRIYAVVAGLGSASDGKAKSIYAPRKEGQLLAVSRAYERSDISPEQITLIEGHGTGTPVGDACEVTGLREFFGNYELPRHSIALGSVKSQIGHTTQAAGAASAIKVALSLHHRVIPPTINISEPNPDYNLDESPFYLATDAVPWFQEKPGHRCAAVSSFGFGGINYHMLLEQHQADSHTEWHRVNPLPHLIILSAAEPVELRDRCQQLLTELGTLSEFDDEALLLRKFNSSEIPQGHCRLAMVARDRSALETKLTKAITSLKDNDGATNWQLPGGIYFRSQALPDSAKTVVMFSGQGAQYLEMGKTLALNFPEMHAAFAEVDEALRSQGEPALSGLLFPNGVDKESRGQINSQLKRTEHVQPALAGFCAGAYDILRNLGFKTDMALGHSFGELTALWAAGALSRQDFFRLSVARGQAMQSSKNDQGDPGAMLAVNQPPDNLAELIAPISGVSIANLNSPDQLVLSGSTEGILKAAELLGKKQLKVVQLPVSGAFHSEHMKQAVAEFSLALKQTKFKRCQLPVFANLTAVPYRNTKNGNAAKFRKTLAAHLEGPVLFRQSLEAAYQAGGRIFVEIGPKAILSSFAKATLKGTDAEILSINPSADKDAVEQLFELQAQLQVLGIPLKQDPYQNEIRMTNSNAKKVLVTLQGRHYFTPESLERINRANDAGNNNGAIIDNNASKNASNEQTGMVAATSTPEVSTANPALNKDSTMPESKPAISVSAENKQAAQQSQAPVTQTSTPAQVSAQTSASLSINDVLQCQTANSQVQNLFYQTQAQQIQTLDRLMQHQQSILEKLETAGGASSEQISQINAEHAQAFDALCQQSQNMFATHDAFLSNQNTILARLLGQDAGALRQAELQITANPLTTTASADLTTPLTTSLANAPTSNTAAIVYGTAQGLDQQPAMMTAETNQPINAQSISSQASTTQPGAAQEIPSPEELSATLLQVVSDTTGYPTDVIDLDMNLEADLGIDSIKRVQIFSSLNELYPDYGNYVNIADLAELTTLQQIIDYFANLAETATPASDSPPMTATNPEATSTSGKPSAPMTVEYFTQLMLDTIAKTTGYPVDVIDVDMDLEADLGVDSIKRVELFSVVQEHYEELSKEVDPMDLLELKTLQQIVDFFAERFASNSSTSPSNPADTDAKADQSNSASRDDTSREDVSAWVEANLDKAQLGKDTPKPKKKDLTDIAARYRVAAEKIPLPVTNTDKPALTTFKRHHVLITDDGDGNGWYLSQHLRKHGIHTSLLCFAELSCENTSPIDDGVFEVSLSDLDDNSIASLIGKLSAKQPITGFVHINPLIDSKRSAIDYLDKLESKLLRSVFFICKHLKSHFATNSEKQVFLTAVTRIDGKLGFGERRPRSVIQGGYSGLIKSLKMEDPQLMCRSIDIAPGVSQDEFASIVVQELTDSSSPYLEVGRTSPSARFALKEYPTDVTPEINPEQPNESSVFLVSGGGRGVTARCIEQIARRYKSRFIILGRTAIENGEPEWATSCADEEALRKALLQAMRDAGEKPIPSKIDQTIKKITIQRELKQTLDTIREAGGQAIYVSEDIVNTSAVKNKVKAAAAQLGPITGILHGAGNIADKLLESKLEADFDLVYQSKVDGLKTLLQCAELKKLKFLVLFSSISGFYGQLGQTDYALANEILNKFALMLKHCENLALLRCIDWGPWDGGMVSPSLKKVYEKFSIDVMPIEEGTEFLLDEFRFLDPGAQQILICPKNIGEVRSSLSTHNVMNTPASRRAQAANN